MQSKLLAKKVVAETEGASAEQIKRFKNEVEKHAKEKMEVEYTKGVWYAFGSELATLRLLQIYRNTPNTRVGYSTNMGKWYFSLEPRFNANSAKVTAADTPLHSFTNDEEGMKASIYKNTGNALKGQFNVVFSDIDSGKTAGTKTFPKEEDAISYAKKLTKQKVTASDTDKFDPALNSGELLDKKQGAPLEDSKDLAKMIFAQIYIMHDGRPQPVEQRYFDDKAALKTYCEGQGLEWEILDNPNKPLEKKVEGISKKDSRAIVQSVVAMETAIGKIMAASINAKAATSYFRSLVNNAKHLYWQCHGVPYGQPQTKIIASKVEAQNELQKVEAMLLGMSKLATGHAGISINNMFKDIKAIKSFYQGGLI